ncbi:alpha/beta hydrolase [Streptomyces pseudovenezuelae]|uniref:Pimeloyl-ACP methyl ester carboxylesterase n=1 Tax=Streptomyces pseudovenezuelae TaxID=67350 RepID=A0ABT6LB26_9ACTN|nr:alpha/beta fold hydrolase [Streptomyces pseudovenezuelae]MDH6213492.1 pimeloyl-ACP methyl ester carboxylesterase [Streptomyces pseudovenezuelae]
MATFVLVHGSRGGGWVWDRLRPPLEKAGHTVLTPTLTGLAERHHLSTPDVGVSVHAQDIAELLTFDRLEDAILVGHSYGGMVITAAAALVPDRVGQVVYADAFSPTTGDSAFSLLPWLEKAFAETPASAEWEVAPLDPALLGADEEGTAWLASKLAPMPVRTHQEPLGPGSEEALATKPVTYLHCTGQGFFADLIPSAQQRGFRIVGLSGITHVGLLTQPQTLADELLALVPEAS